MPTYGGANPNVSEEGEEGAENDAHGVVAAHYPQLFDESLDLLIVIIRLMIELVPVVYHSTTSPNGACEAPLLIQSTG